ncbi:MAG: hypothetical protein WCG21_11120 [Eubacteriales bacterium]
MSKETCPIGVRRDGSYYTRIEWTSHTTSDPLIWVNNLIDDDTERNGGTWGANTMGPADVILSFFGEEQNISRIRIFHNVGVPHSVLEELASRINLYGSSDDAVRSIRSADAKIGDALWNKFLTCEMEKREGWFEFVLERPVIARYVRMELVKNFGTQPDCPWTETSEIKLYP